MSNARTSNDSQCLLSITIMLSCSEALQISHYKTAFLSLFSLVTFDVMLELTLRNRTVCDQGTVAVASELGV